MHVYLHGQLQTSSFLALAQTPQHRPVSIQIPENSSGPKLVNSAKKTEASKWPDRALNSHRGESVREKKKNPLTMQCHQTGKT